MVALGIPLAACANGKFVTLSAAGQDFPQADYQILGKTKYDQTWIDKTIESEIAGFGFSRPSKRPASLDQATVVVQPATATKPSVISAIKKKFKKPAPVATPLPQPKPEVVPPAPPPAKKKLLQKLKDKLRGTPQ